MNGPVDVNGNLMKPGDFVVYAPGDRKTSLQFGIIEKIDEEYGTYANGNTWAQFHITVVKTDVHRNIRLKEVRTNDGYVKTDKPQRSGKINYSSKRFMIMP